MIQVSYIIPTLNAQSVLEKCLRSISQQQISKNQYEILIIDGGSIDETLKIAQKYHALIFKNPLKTAEAGKAVGIKHAQGKFICLVDSDNILPASDWLSKMLYPLIQDPRIVGSEPIKFAYRPHSGIIERYSALIGANDPYAFITGVYDKQNHINNKWTGLKVDQIDKHQYILVKLKPSPPIPTIGANGTLFRAEFLKQNLKSDYLFDIDIISQVLQQSQKPIFFAKVKTGIIHTYCESSTKKFIRKQNRRLTDYYYYQPLRQFDWNSNSSSNIIKFTLYTITLLPALTDSIRGCLRQPDLAWFFHPIACYLTLIVYSSAYLKHKLRLLKAVDRDNWNQ